MSHFIEEKSIHLRSLMQDGKAPFFTLPVQSFPLCCPANLFKNQAELSNLIAHTSLSLPQASVSCTRTPFCPLPTVLCPSVLSIQLLYLPKCAELPWFTPTSNPCPSFQPSCPHFCVYIFINIYLIINTFSVSYLLGQPNLTLIFPSHTT